MCRILIILWTIAVALGATGCGSGPSLSLDDADPVAVATSRLERARERVARLESELRMAYSDVMIADSDAREYARSTPPPREFLPREDGTMGTELAAAATAMYSSRLVGDVDMPELKLSYTPEERARLARQALADRAAAEVRVKSLESEIGSARAAAATAEAELARLRRGP